MKLTLLASKAGNLKNKIVGISPVDMAKAARGCFAYTWNQQASEKTYKIKSLANDKPELKKICEGFLFYIKRVSEKILTIFRKFFFNFLKTCNETILK